MVMNRMRRFVGVVFLWVTVPVACLAQGQTPDFAVADAYFAHYIRGEITALAPMMAETIHFEDTASNLHGKQAALDGLIAAFSQFSIAGFDEHRRLRSGTFTLYDGQLKFTYKGEGLGVPGASFDFDVAFVVALKLDGNKVVDHVDYIDIPAFTSQFQHQVNMLRKPRLE